MASSQGYCQVAIEQTPQNEAGGGSTSTTTFDLPYMECLMDPKPQHLVIEDEVRGYMASPLAPMVAEYAPEGTLKLRARPQHMGVLCLAAIGQATTTAGDGSTVKDPDSVVIPVGAYKHVFKWRYDSGITNKHRPSAFKMQYAAPNLATHWKSTGTCIEACDFSTEEGSLVMTLGLKGLYCVTQTDPSITPSLGTAGPFLKGQITLTWLTGSATTEDFTWGIKNDLNLFRAFTTTSKFPDTAEFGENPISQRVSGGIPKRALDPDDYTELIGCAGFTAKIKLTHAENAAGSYKHQMWWEMPSCQYIGWSPDPAKNVRQQKASFDWEAKWGGSSFCTVTLVNSTTSLTSVSPD